MREGVRGLEGSRGKREGKSDPCSRPEGLLFILLVLLQAHCSNPENYILIGRNRMDVSYVVYVVRGTGWRAHILNRTFERGPGDRCVSPVVLG